jgi:hypothetical protein
MSMMLCKLCDVLVDIDADPDALYVIKYSNQCVCKFCRDDNDLLTEFD